MKRNRQGHVINIDWNYCFICQRKQKTNLIDTDETLKTVANNITEIQNLGELDLEWDAITEIVDGSGNWVHTTLYESLKTNNACFHRNCGTKYNKQKLQRLLEKRDDAEQPGPSVRRSSFEKRDFATLFCAICNQTDRPENLHARGSFHASKHSVDVKHNREVTENWKSMALKAGNETLLKHLSSGDASSNELYYHAECNNALWNQCIKIDKENSSENIEMKWRRAQAYESIISFMLEQEAIEPGSTFVVMDLNELYIENLKSFGIEEKTQTTRFTQRLRNSLPNLVSTTINKNTVVLFGEKVDELIVDYSQSPDEFYAALRKVIHPIRTEIIQQDNKFTGSFDITSQVQSVPKTLLALISGLIDGEMTSSDQPSQEALSVAQIIVSQTSKPSKRKAKLKTPTRRRHNKNQETPLLQYVGLKIFYNTRSRKLIDDLYHLGLSVPYDRVLNLTKMFYEELRQSYIIYNCFFPRILRKGIFSVWLKDNIDVNPKANFNKSSYHGTSSSMIQFPMNKADGEVFSPITSAGNISHDSKKLMPLPVEYTTPRLLHPVKFKSELWAPACPGYVLPTQFVLYDIAFSEEFQWLTSVAENLSSDFADRSVYPLGWAAYHALHKRATKSPPGINSLLPLLRDKVSTFNMQAHLMQLNMKMTSVLNPGQTPVDVSDQPVYALTKELQFRHSQIYSKYFPLFGQLHIEQSLLVIHGQLIEGSGLLEILTENKFSMIGLSAVVDVNNIKRARYTLQITLCALFTKLREAASASGTDLSPYDWLAQNCKENTSFLYWKSVIDLQITILLYIRSIREGNFKLHVEVLYKLLNWYFIFDHYNYARWLTIHWFDLNALETTFPDVYNFFLQGHFSFQKSHRDFSKMGLDQIHEQNNKLIKGSGGASDLLNKADDSALIRWETCSPEIARVILEFEDCLDRNDILAECNTKHHEDNQPFHKRFSSDVHRLTKAITVDPFLQERLTKLNNSKITVPESVTTVIHDLITLGEKQLENYIQERLVEKKVPISQPITGNKIVIWKHSDRGDSRAKFDFSPSKAALKKMNSACEHRKAMAEKLFTQEINNIPQSLSKDGKNGIELYHGQKSEITKRFISATSMILPSDHDSKSALVIEMSPLIRAKAFATHSGTLRDFGEFALMIFYEVMELSSNYNRVDLVFDRYFEKSLKEGTRSGRGQGSQFLFEGDATEIPNLMGESFLKNDRNKTELNEYLSLKLLELHQGDLIMVASYQNTALSFPSSCSEMDTPVSVRPCEAEEADQRLVRHTLNLISNGYNNIIVRTIDTDVLILLISYIEQIELNAVELHAYLINSDKYFNIKQIIHDLGSDTCLALPFFFAFTGCDTVSSFYGKGKCKAYDTWLKSDGIDDLTDVFINLGKKPDQVTSKQIDILENYVLQLYGSTHHTLAAERLDKFKKSAENDLRSLPPSREALYQHTLRASYQTGYLWRQSVEELEIPDANQWGWKTDSEGDFQPNWTGVESQVSIQSFIDICSCKTGKCKKCKCAKAKVACLSMCGCSRGCI